MNPVLKVFLIGCGVIIVLGIVAAAVIGWYLKSHSAQWVAQGRAVRAEGAAFGRNTTESQCLSEAMSRYRANRGIVSGIKQRVWLQGCLEASAFEPEFCSAIPAEEQFAATVRWRVARCQDFGLQGDSTCPNIVAEVQRYCVGSERKKKASR